MLSRQLKQQPSMVERNYGTIQEQPMVASRSSWQPQYAQLPSVSTNYQPTRSSVRVFQPEVTRDFSSSSGYRR